jgi:hypothetical protein
MEETSSGADQRAVRRFALQLPVSVKTAAGQNVNTVAESRDVSSHGICFFCDAAVEQNSPIDFTVTLPAEVTMTEPITVRCRGTVLRVDDQGGHYQVAAAINSYEFVVNEPAQADAAVSAEPKS